MRSGGVLKFEDDDEDCAYLPELDEGESDFLISLPQKMVAWATKQGVVYKVEQGGPTGRSTTSSEIQPMATIHDHFASGALLSGHGVPRTRHVCETYANLLGDRQVSVEVASLVVNLVATLEEHSPVPDPVVFTNREPQTIRLIGLEALSVDANTLVFTGMILGSHKGVCGGLLLELPRNAASLALWKDLRGLCEQSGRDSKEFVAPLVPIYGNGDKIVLFSTKTLREKSSAD